MNPSNPYPEGIIRSFDGAQPNASQESSEGTERVTREVAEKTLRALQEMGAGYENIASRMRDENSEPRSATTSMGVPDNSFRPRYRPILPAPPQLVTQPITFGYYFPPILAVPPQPVIVLTPVSSDLVLPAHGPPVPKLTLTGRTHPLNHRPGSTISAAVPQQVKGFACTLCHRALSSKGALAEHIRGHNGEFACPECLASSGQPRNFSGKKILDAHRESVPHERKKGPYKGLTRAEVDAAEALVLMQKGKWHRLSS